MSETIHSASLKDRTLKKVTFQFDWGTCTNQNVTVQVRGMRQNQDNYEYEFEVKLSIDSPYYPEIEFDLADEEITTKGAVYAYYEALGRKIQSTLMPGKYPFPPSMQAALKDGISAAKRKDEDALNKPEEEPAPEKDESVRWFCPNCGTKNNRRYCMECGVEKPE